jgi:hypothetical protein
MSNTNLTRIIRKAIKESVLLNETYNCPCYKTCTETFYGVATETTYVLSDAEATACNLGKDNDTCCDAAKKSPNTGGISNVDTIRRSDRDKARRRPYSAKALDMRGGKIYETRSHKKEINEEKCMVSCRVEARGPGGEGENEWCNCRSAKSKDRCCRRAGWDGASYKPVNPQVDKSDRSIRVRESELVNLINRVINEQGTNNTCSSNSMWCHHNLTNITTNSGWISNMESLAASPGGCAKIVMKESELSSKMNSKIGTTGCTGPKGEGVHRVCNGSNPKWVAKINNKLNWFAQSSSPFMLCTMGTCNDNTNDCN